MSIPVPITDIEINAIVVVLSFYCANNLSQKFEKKEITKDYREKYQ